MSYGAGATLGGGLQVCGASVCQYPRASDLPGAPSDPCRNPPDDGGGSCSAPGSGTDGGIGRAPLDGGGGGDVQARYLPGGRGHTWDGLSYARGSGGLDGGDSVGCSPPPGTRPDPVPGPGASVHVLVFVVPGTPGLNRVTTPPGPNVVLQNGQSSVHITCPQTGVSQTLSCSGADFYFDVGRYGLTMGLLTSVPFGSHNFYVNCNGGAVLSGGGSGTVSMSPPPPQYLILGVG